VGPEPAEGLEQLLEAEYRLARMEARWESRGTAVAVLVVVALVAWALWRDGALKLNLAALRD
jgi:hypothetical protein